MKSIIIIICFFLIGCQNNSDLEEILTKDSDKSFWVVQKRAKDGSLVYTNNQWIFYPNGTAECLVSFDPRKKGTSAIINIESSSNYKWSYDFGDSILAIGPGVKFKITNYNADTISISASNGNHFVWMREK